MAMDGVPKRWCTVASCGGELQDDHRACPPCVDITGWPAIRHRRLRLRGRSRSRRAEGNNELWVCWISLGPRDLTERAAAVVREFHLYSPVDVYFKGRGQDAETVDAGSRVMKSSRRSFPNSSNCSPSGTAMTPGRRRERSTPGCRRGGAVEVPALSISSSGARVRRRRASPRQSSRRSSVSRTSNGEWPRSGLDEHWRSSREEFVGCAKSRRPGSGAPQQGPAVHAAKASARTLDAVSPCARSRVGKVEPHPRAPQGRWGC